MRLTYSQGDSVNKFIFRVFPLYFLNNVMKVKGYTYIYNTIKNPNL